MQEARGSSPLSSTSRCFSRSGACPVVGLASMPGLGIRSLLTIFRNNRRSAERAKAAVASCASCKRTGTLTSKVSCTWLVYAGHVFGITWSFAVNPEAVHVCVSELK
jgi:hypothetical protein